VLGAAFACVIASDPTDTKPDMLGGCGGYALFRTNGPFCGGTRMVWYLLHGNVVGAAHSHLLALVRGRRLARAAGLSRPTPTSPTPNPAGRGTGPRAADTHRPGHPRRRPGTPTKTLVHPVPGRIEAMIARGQQTGALRTDLPPPLAAVYTQLRQTAEQTNAGRVAQSEAGQMFIATLLSALTR
jgi:hypothetical protein